MKALGMVGLLALLVMGGGLVLRFLFPENLARRPPELDGVRAAILKETRLEAEIQVGQFQDQVDLTGKLTVVFPHVPATADKPGIEAVVRELVKEHLPQITEVDVRFADNLRKKPLALPGREPK